MTPSRRGAAGRSSSAVGFSRNSDLSAQALRRLWLSKISGGAGRLLLELCAHPTGMSRAALAAACGFESSGGTFQRYLSTLRSNGLVQQRGQDLIANAELIG